MTKILLAVVLLSGVLSSFGQERADIDSLKSEILKLQLETQQIQLNLKNSQSKFKTGILVATIGYTTTIAGGLMLGRSSDQLGQGLLVAGGVTGVVGTYMMVDAFNYLTGDKRKRRKK
jgi:hypothetical protein